MSTRVFMAMTFGALTMVGCASREFDVYGKSDAKEHVAVSIDLRKPDGFNRQLFYTELNDDLAFRFRRKVEGEHPQVVARFWVKDNNSEPLVVTLEPDRRIRFDIDVDDGRVELKRDSEPIDKDKKDDDEGD